MTKPLTEFISRFSILTPEEIKQISELLTVRSYKKGTVLLKEGELSNECFFVLKGCLRQYRMMDGEEKTVQFYTEEEGVTLFASYTSQLPSSYCISCVEDCELIVGEFGQEQEMYKKFPKLEQITRAMMEQDFGKVQDAYATFIALSPEERYLDLLSNRPGLLQRVPQHQLASYLGVTPESLSRIRKRIAKSK